MPEYTGVPDVEPSTQAAGAYQRVPVSADAFGAGVGEALEGAGDKLMKTAQFFGTVAADNATNNYMDQADKLLYGDPTKQMHLGADGKPVTSPYGAQVYDGGYFSLSGADAVNAKAQVFQQLNQIIANQRAGLPSRRSQEQFDVDTRRLRAKTMEEMGTHADTQYKALVKNINETSATLGLNNVASVAGDDAKADEAAQQVINARVKQAQFEGLPRDGAELRARQEVALVRVNRLLGDPSSAKRAGEVFDANRDLLGSLPDYDKIARQVHTEVAQQSLPGAVDAFISNTVTGAGSQVGDTDAARNAAWGAIPAVAKGPIADQIASFAKAAGANDVETQYAQQTAWVESRYHDRPNPAGTRFGYFQREKPGTLQQQTIDTIKDGRANAAILRGVGIVATPANLYIMHQQGSGGGKALLTAPGDINAVAALQGSYPGRPKLALQAVAHNIGIDYTKPGGEAAAEAAAKSMTVAQFREHLTDFFYGGKGKTPAGSTGTAPGGVLYPTLADSLRAHATDIHAAAEKQAAENPDWKDYPDIQEQFVAKVDREVRLRIDQEDENVRASTDIVDVALANPDNPPTSMEDLKRDPNVANALQVIERGDAKGLMYVEARLKGNVDKALVLGGDVFDFVQRATADARDPQAVTRVTDLAPSIGSGPGAPLTGKGAAAIGELIKLRTSPQGEAELHAIGQFNVKMHTLLSQTDEAGGSWDTKGEIAYTKFMASVLPQITRAAKQGPQALAKLLNDQSPDYIGNEARPFMRSRMQMLKDKLEDSAQTAARVPTMSVQDVLTQTAGMSISQRNNYVFSLISAGRLSRDLCDTYVAGAGAQANAGTPGAGPPPVTAAPPAPGPGGGYPLAAPTPQPFLPGTQAH